MAPYPSVDRIERQSDPAQGIEILWIETSEYTLEIKLDGPPWHMTGRRPFDWSLIPPSGERHWPIVRIFANRKVRITSTPSEGHSFNRVRSSQFHLLLKGIFVPMRLPLPHGSYVMVNFVNQAGNLVGPGYPVFEIYRPQTDIVCHEGGRPVAPEEIFELPYMMVPSRNYSRKYSTDELNMSVTPERNGITFQQARDRFRVRIRIKDPLQPAAYWFSTLPDVTFAPPFVFYVLHSRNVAVQRNHRTVPDKHLTYVRSYRMPLWQVPEMGPDINEIHGAAADLFDPKTNVASTVKNNLEWEKTLKEIFVTAADTTIGMLPVVGTIYDLGTLAYASAHGKDFWGRKVDGAEMVLLGASVLIPGAMKLKR